MARYNDVHYDQDKFIPVSFHKQILPGTSEYTLSYTANVTHLYQNHIEGYSPDLGPRIRDPGFAEAERYRTRAKKDKKDCYGKTQTRQVAIFIGRVKQAPPSYLDIDKNDSNWP